MPADRSATRPTVADWNALADRFDRLGDSDADSVRRLIELEMQAGRYATCDIDRVIAITGWKRYEVEAINITPEQARSESIDGLMIRPHPFDDPERAGWPWRLLWSAIVPALATQHPQIFGSSGRVKADFNDLAPDGWRVNSRAKASAHAARHFPQEQPETRSSNKITAEQARDRAEKIVRGSGGVFPGRNALAERVGCSRTTMDRAIESSHYLSKRKDEYDAQRQGKPREIPASTSNEMERLIQEQTADDQRDKRQQARRATRRR